MRSPSSGSPLLAWLSLVVVYIAWGSTYVAIRVAVRDIPPLSLAGIRFAIAGLLLWPVAVRSGPPALRAADRPGAAQWGACALVGVLLLVGGNGAVTIAEKTVPAGLAALLVATVPLWMAVIGAIAFGDRITPGAVAALVVGGAGVAVIVHPSGTAHLGGLVIVVAGAASWALGSLLAPRLPLPRRALLSSALEMLVGGVVLLALAAALGEFGRFHTWSGTTILSMIILVVAGSWLGFTCYAYALTSLPAQVVSTYAYVNPVVAVALGWLLLDERLSWGTAGGAALIVGSVAATVLLRSRHPTASTSTAYQRAVATATKERR